MKLKKAYIQADKQTEIEFFRKTINVDVENLYIDLNGADEEKSRVQYTRLLEGLKDGDTLVISSFENVCFGLASLCRFIETIRDMGVKLEILTTSPNEKLLTQENGLESLQIYLDLQEQWELKETYNPAHKERKKPDYPENFLSVCEKYNKGDIKSKEAADELGIPVYTWYKLSNHFN